MWLKVSHEFTGIVLCIHQAEELISVSWWDEVELVLSLLSVPGQVQQTNPQGLCKKFNSIKCIGSIS